MEESVKNITRFCTDITCAGLYFFGGLTLATLLIFLLIALL